MKKQSVYIIIVLIVAVGILMLIKSDKGNFEQSAPIKSPTKIGAIIPLTGIVAAFGEEEKRGIEAAKRPGTEVLFEDDQCDPKLAVAAFKKLTELDHVRVIIGPMCGSSQEVVAPLARDKGVLLLLPAAASSHLFEVSGGSLYNTQYSLEKESTFNAEEMVRLGHKRVAILSYPNSFSKSHVDAFKKAYKGTIVADVLLPVNNSVPQTEITKLASKDFEAIYSPDISFYFGDGLKKLEIAGIKAPLFSTYVVELPMARSVVGSSYYSFPSDIIDGKGGAFSLAKEALELIAPIAAKCESSYICMKQALSASGKFDKNGVSNRSITLKQIVGGEPVVVTK
jgi:ABC-type branched-subunit amino acid transport system substrate-binding protein